MSNSVISPAQIKERNQFLHSEYELLKQAEDSITAHATTLSCLYDDDVFSEAAEAILQLVRHKIRTNTEERLSMLEKALQA